MASESELSSEDEEKESAEEGKDSPQAKRVKVSKSRSSSTTPKSAKKLKPNQSRGSGKTFTYRGTARVKTNYDNSDFNMPGTSSSSNEPRYEQPSQPQHHLRTDHVSTGTNENLDEFGVNELLAQLQNEVPSFPRPYQTTHQQREASLAEAWGNERRRIFKNYVSQQPLRHSKCDNCSKQFNKSAVRCMYCKKHFCFKCDTETHLTSPFHRRHLVSSDDLITLLPDMFIDQNSEIIRKDVCVPCFVPSECQDCKSCMKLTPSKHTSVVAVTEQGRFLLKAAVFECTKCTHRSEASIDDYIFSEFWPGSTSKNISYLFSNEAMLLRHHIEHKSPGSSENMYVESLVEISKEYGREGPVNLHLFSNAKREWQTSRYYIHHEILKRNLTNCATCGEEPVMKSSDAIVKMRRLKSAGAVKKLKNTRIIEEQQSRFGPIIIKPDAEVEAFRERIYQKIPSTKKKQMCGGAAFKAAKEDSNYYRKYDETGLVISTCKHHIVHCAINMFKGESFTHALYLHNEAAKLGAKHFCYDVFCTYSKWLAEKVFPNFPEFRRLILNMDGFLPVMHSRAHHWPCQVLWNPRWKTGVGLTDGEQHERVFSYLYRFAYVLKHMTKINRHDFITLIVLYWNWYKMETMPISLSKQLQEAKKAITENLKNMNELLHQYNLTTQDLPIMKQELEEKANSLIYTRQTKKTGLDKLKRSLEGLYIQLKNVSIAISKEAETSKARTKFRRVLTEIKEKALKLINLINSKHNKKVISYEDFDGGVFPWESSEIDKGNNYRKLTLSQKYQLVNYWMLWKRGKEEIILTKKEMVQYVKYLISTRNSLQLQHTNMEDDTEQPFSRGKSLLAATEVRRVNSKILHTIQKFNLHSLENFNDLEQSETTQSDSEFDFDSQNESSFESDSEEILSDLENSDSQVYEDEKE